MTTQNIKRSIYRIPKRIGNGIVEPLPKNTGNVMQEGTLVDRGYIIFMKN